MLTNKELEEAIDDIDGRLRICNTELPRYNPLLEHLKGLLAEQLRRAQTPGVEEGCTPTDARVLREANHKLAQNLHEAEGLYEKGLLDAVSDIDAALETTGLTYPDTDHLRSAAVAALALFCISWAASKAPGNAAFGGTEISSFRFSMPASLRIDLAFSGS